MILCRLKDDACKAKLIGKKNKSGGFDYTEKHTHTHLIDVRDKAVKVRVAKAMESAKSSAKSSREIYAESLNGAQAEVVANMSKANAITRAVRLQRKGDHPKNPKDLNELVLEDVRTTVGEYKTICFYSFC